VALLDTTVGWAVETNVGPLTGGKHRVRRKGQTDVLHEAGHLEFAHARANAPDHTLDALRRVCSCELELGQFVELNGSSHATCRVHEERSGVADSAEGAERVS